MRQPHSSKATWTLFPDVYRHLEGVLGKSSAIIEKAFFTLKRSFHMDRCGVTGALFCEGNLHPMLELKMGKDYNVDVQKERLLILFRAEEQLNKAAAILIR